MLTPLFNIDDFITGIDRTFARSIYRYAGIAPGQPGFCILELIAYEGYVVAYSTQKNDRSRFSAGLESEFRIATDDEIRSACTPKKTGTDPK
jgi:hypothetical protein